MNIDPIGPARQAGGASGPSPSAAPCLDDGQHAELARRSGYVVMFCTGDSAFAQAQRARWTADLGDYLEQGYLAGDADDGPVRRLTGTASHAEGVAPGEVNLELREGVQVFGFLDNQGVGNCYYACRAQRGQVMFFTLCIESGEPSRGPYDIFVSAPGDWATFLASLPSS